MPYQGETACRDRSGRSVAPTVRRLLREIEAYLQSPQSTTVSRGSCPRLVHKANLLSEDLDFDHFDLLAEDFDSIAELVSVELEIFMLATPNQPFFPEEIIAAL